MCANLLLRLHCPAVLLGYEPIDATYLNIYLSVSPPLNIPEPIKEKLECEESDAFVKHCERWTRDLAAKYPERKVLLRSLYIYIYIY